MVNELLNQFGELSSSIVSQGTAFGWFSWNALGNAANVLQILTAIPVFLAAMAYLLHRRRVKKALDELERGGGERPAALVINCMAGSIRAQVEGFLKQQGIQMKFIEEYSQTTVSINNVHAYLEDLRGIRDRMVGEGVTVLHLFMRGPLALAIGVGALYDSVFPVHVYQYGQDPTNQKSGYEYWITLHRGAIAGIPASKAEQVLEETGRI